MRLSYKKVLGLESSIIAILIIWAMNFQAISSPNLFSIIVWSLILFIFHLLVGIERDRTSNKVDTLQVIFLYTVIYFIIIYLLGIFVGFTHTPYNLSFLQIIKNILPLMAIIILQEIFRYNVIVKCKTDKLIVSLLIIIFIAFDILLNIHHYSFSTKLDIFEVIGVLILPSIANNILLTFMDYKGGYYPTILYRLITELYLFVIPIVPDFNIYIQAILNIVFPTVLFLKFNAMYAKNAFSKAHRSHLFHHIVNTAIAIFVIAVVVLVSGAFKYYAMAIGSASMSHTIEKGDAVVVKKINDNDKLEKGMVISFAYGGTVICHRIYAIETKNDEIVITTKGDNNDSPDNWTLSRADVIGIVQYKVPVIGWPSVWLSEYFKNKS